VNPRLKARHVSQVADLDRSASANGEVIRVEGLERAFDHDGQRVVAFEDVSFGLRDGEFATIVGPSGCGKTTLLNVVAGLIEPTAGRVLISGEDKDEPRHEISYMFQKDLLLPWRNIRDNVALGLEIQRLTKREARRRSQEMLEHFGLGPFAFHYPFQLSGGMRQRVALMRTLLCDRPILLLDEPFGALDALTRSFMQEWLLEIWAEAQRTILFVTHDIEEAVFLSDRVLVMTARPGRIKAEVVVGIPRPRRYGIVTSGEFISAKEKLLGLLHEEGMKVIRAEEATGLEKEA
jgi:ABC-type nitrate/sulfonate/bicarbonate transport system ATPase subunit